MEGHIKKGLSEKVFLLLGVCMLVSCHCKERGFFLSFPYELFFFVAVVVL